MARNQVRREIYITCNGKTADDMIKALTSHVEQLDKAIQQLRADGKGETKECKEMIAVRKQLSKQIKENVSDTQLIEKVTKNLAGSSTKQLRAALAAVRREIERSSEAGGNLTALQKKFAMIKGQIDKNTGAIHKQSGAWRTALKNLTAYVGLFSAFNQIKTYFVDLFRLNMQFSEQLTDIRKVALSTTEEVSKLSRELAKIETRTSLEELNRIAYAGAKLGVQTQGGMESLASFVRAADQVNVALKEDLGDEALTALAKITEVMGLIKEYGVEQSMLKAGSAIFRLASTSTATSERIVDFSNRMLSLGEQAALTTPDILALGAAVDSMALEPEVAATAFGKLVMELRMGTSSIEKDLGIAQGSLKKLINEGKGMEAILTIFRTMGESGNVFALDDLFKDMGSEGTRLIKTMVTMAAKNGMLTKAVEESNKAFNDGTAVTVEYNMQQETAQAYMERANNLLEKQFVSATAANGPIRDMAKAWFEVTKELTSSMSFMTEVRVAITLLFASVKTMLFILPTLITVLSTAGLAGAFTKLLVSLQSVELASLSLGSVWAKMVATFDKLSIVKQAGIMGGLIGLLGVGVIKIAQWTASLNQMSAAHRVLNEVQEEGKRQALEEQEQLKRLHNVMNDTSASMNLRLEAMNKLNSAIPNLNAKINDETGAVMENTKAWEDNFRRLQDYYELEGARSKLSELGRQKVDAILDLQKKEEAYANANADIQTGRPVTSGGAVMASQAQGVIGQAGQRAAAKRARDEAQRTLDDIEAQERALQDKFGANLAVGSPQAVGKPQSVSNGGNNATTPEDDARNNIAEFITKIKTYYERQITATVEDLTKQGVPKSLQKYAENDIRSRMNAVLSAAQTSLVLGTKEWEKERDKIGQDLKEKDDEYGQSQSRLLLEQIMGFNVRNLRAELLKQMPKIKRGKIVGLKSDERDRAYLDSKWLEASKGDQKVANINRDIMERRRKELLEYNYTDVVKENSFLGLIDAGMADVTLANFERDKNEVIKVLETARAKIVDLYSTGGEKDKLLKMLFGENYENLPQQFTFLLDETDENVKYFYYKLIRYSDEYTAAQKRQYDTAKKIVDQMWAVDKRNLAQQEKLRKMEKESKMFGKRTNWLSNLGLADLTADPEIELMKARMQAAEDYYAFVKANSKNQQLVDEAEKARQQAELNYVNQVAASMKERLSQMKELVQPVVDFGSAVGSALANMSEDTKSFSDSMKETLKSMLQSWSKMALDDVNTQLWKAINDAGAKRASKKAQPDINAARDSASANVTKIDETIGTAQNPAHVIVENGKDLTGVNAEVANPTGIHGAKPSGVSAGTNPNAPSQGAGIAGTPSALQGVASQTGEAVAEAATGGDLRSAAAGVAMSGANALLNTEFSVGGKKSKEDKERAKQLKEQKKHEKDLTKEAKKGAKEREKVSVRGIDSVTQATKEGNKDQTKNTEEANTIMANSATQLGQTLLTTEFQTNQQIVQSDAQRTQASMTFSIAGAMAKCFDFLGPIAGPIAAAAVMATLTGLMQWAMSKAFSGSKKADTSGPKNTKLVSGMLTYDSGNVQDLKPFVADNGEIYWATEDDGKRHSGVTMLSTPTATTINGRPSLVAENGPEIVIGRETTHAMMMNNPALLKALVNYDRNYSGRSAQRRAYDEGNVGEALGNLSSGASATDGLIADSRAANLALLDAVNALLQRLNEPINAKIDMYGRGNLYDSMKKANQFMKGK